MMFLCRRRDNSLKKPQNLLNQKIQSLEEKLKQKNKLLKKYQKHLDISNTRIKKIAKDLKQSLSLVRDIHKNLIPVRLPHISGFELSYKFLPTKQGVSGDFFDVVKIQDSMNFGILLSSCNTYAITSLFLSSFLKASPHLKKYRSAKEFVSFVAEKMSPSLAKKEKVHLFYGVISRSSFELDYYLTGNIFAGYKAQGKDMQVLPACSSHLYDKKPLKGRSLALNAKDILLICSPGVVKRTNEEGEAFGTENIIKSVNEKPSAGVLEIRQNVLFSCNEFGKNRPIEKDCTVLAIKAMNRILRVQKPS